MHDIIFSTANHHRLTVEPRVTLKIDPESETVLIAYSHANVSFEKADDEEIHPVSKSIPRILFFLCLLWMETRPDSPLPPGLSLGQGLNKILAKCCHARFSVNPIPHLKRYKPVLKFPRASGTLRGDRTGKRGHSSFQNVFQTSVDTVLAQR